MRAPLLPTAPPRLLSAGFLSRAWRRRALAAIVSALVAGTQVPVAEARRERTMGWDASKVFAAAVRFLRVDQKLVITEKDADAGYVMFEFVDDGKTYPGALELVDLADDTGPGARVIVTLTDRPDYLEERLLERLERRLREDLGTPPPRKPKAKPVPRQDPAPSPPAPEGTAPPEGPAPKR